MSSSLIAGRFAKRIANTTLPGKRCFRGARRLAVATSSRSDPCTTARGSDPRFRWNANRASSWELQSNHHNPSQGSIRGIPRSTRRWRSTPRTLHSIQPFRNCSAATAHSWNRCRDGNVPQPTHCSPQPTPRRQHQIPKLWNAFSISKKERNGLETATNRAKTWHARGLTQPNTMQEMEPARGCRKRGVCRLTDTIDCDMQRKRYDRLDEREFNVHLHRIRRLEPVQFVAATTGRQRRFDGRCWDSLYVSAGAKIATSAVRSNGRFVGARCRRERTPTLRQRQDEAACEKQRSQENVIHCQETYPARHGRSR